MNRGGKWLLAIITLILLPLPALVFGANWKILQPYVQMKLPPIQLNNLYLRYYLLAASLVVFMGLLISLCILIFYPTRHKLHLINKNYGRLTVTSKAINNFVKTSLEAEPYLHNPKVSSRLTKRHIKINVSGDLLAGSNAQGKFDNYLHNLEDDLRNLLGIGQKPKIRIQLTNYHPDNEQKKRQLQ
ncbi:alkaline shock response membrane anchor protein AmaP [Bombilactobacillus bombi]|uniref:alkaline shock response membrane anchor protein AmaP n=1 Tax=Bombilactobacillus bombi TaxID=1303590 RepID=UPI0015E5EA02|nr:alkaline shock response membrane anchor protein AmaP [Bombilactobacillus bombi]